MPVCDIVANHPTIWKRQRFTARQELSLLFRCTFALLPSRGMRLVDVLARWYSLEASKAALFSWEGWDQRMAFFCHAGSWLYPKKTLHCLSEFSRPPHLDLSSRNDSRSRWASSVMISWCYRMLSAHGWPAAGCDLHSPIAKNLCVLWWARVHFGVHTVRVQ